MKRKRKVGRNAGSGQLTTVAKAKANPKTHTVETMPARRRDTELGDKIDALRAAVGRVEAVLAAIERRLSSADEAARYRHRVARQDYLSRS